MTGLIRMATAVVVIFCLMFLNTSLYAATDTTIKGTTSDSTQVSLDVTNLANTQLLSVRNDGNIGIGQGAPTAFLHIKAGASTANAGAPIKLTAGTNLTTAEDGAVEMDADAFYGTTDAGNRGYVPVRHFLRADGTRTFTSNTSAQSIFNSPTNGRITLETGTYKFEGLLVVTSMGTGASDNASYNILGAGTATTGAWLWKLQGIDNSTPSTLLDDDATYLTSSATAASCVTGTTGSALRVSFEGTFEVTGAGTLIPSQTMVAASASVLSVGSYIMFERIGSTTATNVGQWD